jgi:hypothetical protein
MGPEERSKEDLIKLLEKIEVKRTPKERIESQLNLFAGFENEKMVTLKELIKQAKYEELAFPMLSFDKQAEITMERIKAQEKLEIFILDVGLIDKERALKEIEERSEIGMELIEIEKQAVKFALEDIKKQLEEGRLLL